jgi:hypothetical protein
MKLASTVILFERELVSATQTIENILQGVSLRVDQLAGAFPSYLMNDESSPSTTAESFRQQGNDPKARFRWYAHGLVRGDSNFTSVPSLISRDSTTFGTVQN